MSLRSDADSIIRSALLSAQPDFAVKKALKHLKRGYGKLILIAAGKAAWQMAAAACDALDDQIDGGIVITKYGHSRGPLPGLTIFEAGHPIPDCNSFIATEEAVSAVSGLTEKDTVLFLLSGGGSALFEKPLVSRYALSHITSELLACGADIVEMNTIRKRLSAVKGGRFAQLCAPAHVFSVILSDIIGDPLDMIASGPAYPDQSTCSQAMDIVEKYQLAISPEIKSFLMRETPKTLDNVETYVTGSVRELCNSASLACQELGYTPFILTASLSCEAKEAGAFLSSIAQYHSQTHKSLAILAGGETVVRLTGRGLGGRNQELALSAAIGIEGLNQTAIFSVGSDGTDGPTDAAGGYVDSSTASVLKAQGIDIHSVLRDNDSYHALEKCGGLIKTGPTGTNVNDLAAVLIKRS